ncbi:hypothetical protein QA612_20685 [Evansella sp. AB-P1]|uniref:hypothetical protein n=1 Tax=Evansella sp. AB-P1 TaxID=3037653 RepID=UPI00242001D1|nr:hypothetical protein [Evansella sp. AB-P1]MDG5789877.1 hypothetical protein [Evansella sp. AB-P1]
MAENFCISCGNARKGSANFCGNCGKKFSSYNIEKQKLFPSHHPKPLTLNINGITKFFDKGPRGMISVFISIILAVLLYFSAFYLESYMHYYAPVALTYFTILIILIIAFQVWAVSLQLKRRSFSPLIPTFIGMFCVLVSGVLIRDFTSWINQNSAFVTRSDISDLILILFTFIFYIFICGVNIFTTFFIGKTEKIIQQMKNIFPKHVGNSFGK